MVEPNKKDVQSIAFCITINNPEGNETVLMETCDFLRGGIVGKEIGANGTHHLQGYVQCKRKMRWSTFRNKMKKLLGGPVSHIEPARGNVDENVKYCSKDGDFVEWGKFTGQGHRTDWEAVNEMIEEGKGDYEIQQKYPNLFATSYKGIAKMRDNKTMHENNNKLQDEFKGAELRLWQIIALNAVLTQGNRTVTWYVDYAGNAGKTWLAKYMVAVHDAFYCCSGKAADIAHAYKCEPIVVFDFTRSKEETVNYSVIEKMKDGMIFSPKYQSVTKVFPPAKVICFSNWDPDTSKLSKDRWDIHYVSGTDVNGNAFSQLGDNGFLFPEDVSNINEGNLDGEVDPSGYHEASPTPPPKPLLERSNAQIFTEADIAALEADDEKDDETDYDDLVVDDEKEE